MSWDGEPRPWERKDAIQQGTKGFLIGGGAGLAYSSFKNALVKENVRWWGVFARTGSAIYYTAAMGGSYMFVKALAGNYRNNDDAWNPAIGGLAAGMIAGFRYLSLPHVVFRGLGFAVLMGGFHFMGGSLRGFGRAEGWADFDYREQMRADRRRHYSEMVRDLGHRSPFRMEFERAEREEKEEAARLKKEGKATQVAAASMS